ncbi:Gp138 family membrane-puncturing spike protein [Aliarcobacter lanthieri]|uniref:Gp138 family membrane-puncturing spike protein n=1 Tax=Aliarcobacter lanthieri TaxID=1355374 RepID=UPI003AACDF25
MLIPNNTPPKNELTANLKMFIESFIKENLDDMLPCRVIAHNRDTNRVDLQPLIMLKTTDGNKLNRQIIKNIPVFRFGGGGFFISVPINNGDFGWIKANDRDISLMFQGNGKADIPNTKRLHSFNDGLFFPDTLKDWIIDGKNANALVLSSLDGSTCLALDNGRVEMDTQDLIINATNVQINSSTLKHNDKNIGDTHNHPQNDGNHFGGGVNTNPPNP